MKRKFLVLFLPIALLAGCGSTGDVKLESQSALSSNDVQSIEESAVRSAIDLDEVSSETESGLTSDNVTLELDSVAWGDGAFTLDGVDYVLGGNAKDYEAKGWKFDEDYNETDMIPAGELTSVRFLKDSKSMYLKFNNESDNAVSCYDLKVMGVETDTTCAVDLFVHGAGTGNSYDEVYKTLGPCNQKYSNEEYKALTYETTEADVSLSYVFYDNDGAACTGVTYMDWRYGGL